MYFYDFSDDGYFYSKKKEYENDFQERANRAVDDIKHRTIIDGKSYWEKPNEKLDNMQYVCKKEQKITYNDFINTLIDYAIYELNCCKIMMEEIIKAIRRTNNCIVNEDN